MQHELLTAKIRDNLEFQKSRLSDYLNLLEDELKFITAKDGDKLLSLIRVETDLIGTINNYKKVLSPLLKQYADSPFKKDETLIDLQDEVSRMSNAVSQKLSSNQAKLNSVIADMQVAMQNKPKINIPKSSYNRVDPTHIDIRI